MTGNPQAFRLSNLPRVGGLLDSFTGFSPHISRTGLRTPAGYRLCPRGHGGSHEAEITENTETKVPWTVRFGWAFERRQGRFGGDWWSDFDPVASGLESRTDLAGNVCEFPATGYLYILGDRNWGRLHHSVIDDGYELKRYLAWATKCRHIHSGGKG